MKIKKIQAFLKKTPSSRRRRLNAKTRTAVIPADSIQIPADSSSMKTVEAEMKNDIADQFCLTPEGDLRMTCFFKFVTTAPHDCEPGSLNLLAAEVARCFPEVAIEVGEARALAVYSSMSGILAKVPPWENFGDATAIKIYVAALCYIGWELAGSVDILDGPSIIFTVQRAHLMSAVHRFLGYMSS